ncbi:hypothetical protein SD37_39900 [Amycolatopsis orientalis]|uniref:IrrE N-terminal-like domain-containing protein n=1 Tax=Amycolatopsis orientalis TaxID=31958 RepID=A0A193CA03_AMYOR|nr:hypothetical protein [Amycolatopsis orientalis]ANN21150.1 hypothetical protein SD37_39900 [Amycolatopsis orientalis]
MSERRIRRQCREMLSKLDVRPPLDVTELCRQMGEIRGKPIRLIAYPIPVPGPFGMWISTPETDYILFQQETSKRHQDHIVLHELGHILGGHQGALDSDVLPDGLTTPGTRSLSHQYPDIGDDAVKRALRRTAYDTDHEREAEAVATIILEWASILNIAAPRPSDGAARGMDTALGARIGWL